MDRCHQVVLFTFRACLANKRLWFLKKLKRVAVSENDRVYDCETIVRPVLEYANPDWHTRQRLLKQFSDGLVSLLPVAVHIQKTVHCYG